jgi:hypothetical protein
LDLITLAYVGSLVAAAASVGSLLAVAWQLRSLSRQTREAARQTEATAEATRAVVYLSTAQTMIGIDQFLLDRPQIRSLLYGALASGADDLDAHRAQAAAEMMIDMIDAVAANDRHLSLDIDSDWLRYVRHLMHRSPAIREFWRTHRDWYSDGTRQLLDACAPAEVSAGG